jgi:hypothetical protein
MTSSSQPSTQPLPAQPHPMRPDFSRVVLFRYGCPTCLLGCSGRKRIGSRVP